MLRLKVGSKLGIVWAATPGSCTVRLVGESTSIGETLRGRCIKGWVTKARACVYPHNQLHGRGRHTRNSARGGHVGRRDEGSRNSINRWRRKTNFRSSCVTRHTRHKVHSFHHDHSDVCKSRFRSAECTPEPRRETTARHRFLGIGGPNVPEKLERCLVFQRMR